MKSIFFLVFAIAFGTTAFAKVTSVKGRVFDGFVNSKLGPFGAILNMDTGEVLYVTSIISVLEPKELDPTCIYTFSTIPDKRAKHKAITLVSPTKTISCGHKFPRSR